MKLKILSLLSVLVVANTSFALLDANFNVSDSSNVTQGDNAINVKCMIGAFCMTGQTNFTFNFGTAKVKGALKCRMACEAKFKGKEFKVSNHEYQSEKELKECKSSLSFTGGKTPVILTNNKNDAGLALCDDPTITEASRTCQAMVAKQAGISKVNDLVKYINNDGGSLHVTTVCSPAFGAAKAAGETQD